MKSQNKKQKSIEKKSKKIEKNSNPDEININTLKNYLSWIIPHFTSTDFDLIYTIFGKREQEYLSLIDNVKKEHRSDSIICYGNNNQILKVFLDNAIKNYQDEINISTISINGYFDSNEESLLKEICNNLNVKSKAGYDNYRKALDNFFLKQTQDESMIIIYCDYIDHLVHKKKQRLLYTLFELINKSRNILLIGFTYNYNLMDQMEKRIRSRSSQKTMYINIDDFQSVLNAIEKSFHKNIFNNNEENKKDKLSNEEIKEFEICGKYFYDCLINEESEDYVFYLEKLVKLGTSIDGILTKIQNHLLMVKIKIDNYQKNFKTDYINKNDLSEIIIKITKKIVEDEKRGYTLNMLLKCSKFQLCLFICLTSCVSQFRERILLSTFYNKYKTIMKLNKRSSYDLILIQKFLEDLNNCNLISIRNDEKYGKLYQLKLPLSEIRKILHTLKISGKLDTEMIKLCDNIKW
jgi:Cdc6-like AAA superfamily ATPase